MEEKDGEVDRALKRAVRKAILRHKALGQSIIVWREGKLTKLQPSEI
jgi:hypothetical protein